MYLKNITLKGFKTFADKTTLEFDSQGSITCVVGPNGCGKSNIIDALRWVMGEQSLKDLRSTTLEEVIFAGSRLRKPLSLAEAIIILDNSDGILKTEYNEVSVKRRIFRSGESEFYINKNPCRLKDIRDLFLDTGLGSGTYSLINQGGVDAILSSKAEDRRAPFEEAAGINKYKTRKIAAEKKLIATEQNLLRVNDLKLELSTQLSTLEEQAKKAKEYKEIKENLKRLEIGIYKKEMKSVNTKMVNLKEKVVALRHNLSQSRTEIEEDEKNREDLKNNLKNKEEQIEQAQKEIEENSTILEEKKRSLVIELEREKNLHDRLEEAKKESLKLLPLVEEYKERLKGNAQEKERLNALVEELKLKVENREKEYSDIENEIKQSTEEATRTKEQIFNAERECASKKNELLELDGNRRFAEEELKRDETSKEKLVKDKDELCLTTKTLEQEIESLESRLKNLNGNLSSLLKEKDELERELKKIQTKKDETKEKLSGNSSKLDLIKDIEKSGYSYTDGVKESLKRAGHGLGRLFGIVTETIKVKEGYEAAIESALEESLESIIVKDTKTAEKFIHHLKKGNTGRASFIILEDAMATSKNPIIKSETGYLGLAYEFVETNEEFRPLLQSLLSNTVIIDTLSHALGIYLKRKKEKSQLKLVTRDGDVLIPGLGKISGGSPKMRSIIGRKKEMAVLEGEVEKTKETLENILQQETHLISDRDSKESIISSMSEESSKVKIELGALKHKKDVLDKQMGDIIEELELINQGIDARRKEKEEISEGQDILTKEIKEHKEEIAHLAHKLKKLEEDGEKEKRLLESTNQKLTNERIALSAEEAKLNQADIYIKDAEENLKRFQAELSEKSIEDIEVTLKQTKEKTISIEKEVPSLEDRKKELRQNEEKFKNERAEILQNIETLETSIRKRNEVERSLGEKVSKEEISLAKLEGEESAMAERMKEEYGVTIEEIMASKEDMPNISKAKWEVDDLKIKLKLLEPVNLLAVEEYEKSRDRLTFIQNQYDDLKEARENLSILIKELDAKARENFIKTIQIVGEHFSKIFSTLFEGGEAKLMLVEGEDILDAGIEIMAKPHGKKWLSLQLLSGGERALTAIAILFALLKTHPSPFCFLDEVDAALDDANIYRFTKMLKDFSKDIQMIVITHNKRTMATANTLYGITMEEPGISKLVSMKLAKVA